MISRRSFSKSSLLAATAAASSSPGALWAAGKSEEPHFFIFLQVFGAWDVCLAFDPKNRDELDASGQKVYDQPYDINEVREFSGVRLAPTGFALSSYADRMTVINGIDMLIDNNHIPDAAMTGMQNPRGANQPFLQAIIAGKHPFVRRRQIPHLYLSYDGQFFAGNYASKSINTSVADFASLFGTTETSRTSDSQALSRMLARYRNVFADQQSRLAFTNYVRSVDQSSEVSATLVNAGFEAPSDPENASDIGKFLALLFKSGVLGSATLSFGSRYMFDTHSDHYAQHPLGQALTDAAAILDQLKKIPFSATESVYDRTTLAITAEYARTPLLNSAQGKDHNFRTNSVVLVGRNARSVMYGASGSRVDSGGPVTHAALPIDFSTGMPSETGRILTMKDVWAGSSRIFGLDVSKDFGADARPVTFL